MHQEQTAQTDSGQGQWGRLFQQRQDTRFRRWMSSKSP